MAWQTREWWTKSDIWPLKQPRINGLNRQAPLEGCERVMRTSTSHSASIHLPFRIHALPQLEIPDVKPPVEKKGDTDFLPQRQRRFLQNITLNLTLAWWFVFREQHFWVKGTFGGLSVDGFQVRTGLTGGVTVYMQNQGGKRYKTLQGLQSRSRGKWNMETVTGAFWHFALWASLKRFKHQLRSESGSYKYESPAWEDTLCCFKLFRSVNIYIYTNQRKLIEKALCSPTLSAVRNIFVYFGIWFTRLAKGDWVKFLFS